MFCIDEFAGMKSAEIWKGEWQSQHFCFQISLFFTHTAKNHNIATAPYLQYIKNCIWNQVAALSARDKGPFLETCSEVHTNFHRLHWVLEKALRIITGSFVPKTSAHFLTSQGIWSLGVQNFAMFPSSFTHKSSKVCSDTSKTGEREIFTTQACALYNQSFADEPPDLRRLKRTDALSLHLSVFYPPWFPWRANQRLLLTAM